MTVLLHFAPKHTAELRAPLNGGPAEPLSSSGIRGGPPWVS